MTDIGKLKSNVAKAQAADALMSHPLIQEAFDTLTRATLDEFAACDPLEFQKLSAIRIKLQTIQDFKTHFDLVLRGGEIARRELETIEQEQTASRLTG